MRIENNAPVRNLSCARVRKFKLNLIALVWESKLPPGSILGVDNAQGELSVAKVSGKRALESGKYNTYAAYVQPIRMLFAA